MESVGIPFEIDPSSVEESLDPAISPETNAERIAFRKAADVAARRAGRYVLGADTIVVLKGRVLGKPEDRSEAERMLKSLSGSRHRVITGVCLLAPSGEKRLAHETSWVTMRPISPAEVEAYLDSGEWEGKAGAYAIQETADRFVAALEGPFDNVVGLPTGLVRRLLAKLGYAG